MQLHWLAYTDFWRFVNRGYELGTTVFGAFYNRSRNNTSIMIFTFRVSEFYIRKILVLRVGTILDLIVIVLVVCSLRYV